jgi:integrase
MQYGGMGSPRLLDRVRECAVARGLHPRTRAAYRRWVVRYVRHHGMRHPAQLGRGEVEAFLAALVAEGGLTAATQRQARSALRFLYGAVLGVELGVPLRTAAWRPPPPLPVAVVRALLERLPPVPRLMAQLLYGAGLRVGECCALRIRDVELARGVIRVRRADGGQDRLTLIPMVVREALAAQMAASRRLQQQALPRGGGATPYPVLGAGDGTSLSLHWRWMWVFPSSRTRWHGEGRRHVLMPLDPSSLQRAVRAAARAAGVPAGVGPVTCGRLRHTFGAQLLAAGYPIAAVQGLLGHRDRGTTLRYHDALPVGWLGVRSPLDFEGGASLPASLTPPVTLPLTPSLPSPFTPSLPSPMPSSSAGASTDSWFGEQSGGDFEGVDE